MGLLRKQTAFTHVMEPTKTSEAATNALTTGCYVSLNEKLTRSQNKTNTWQPNTVQSTVYRNKSSQ